jgi:hypothetical protein
MKAYHKLLVGLLVIIIASAVGVILLTGCAPVPATISGDIINTPPVEESNTIFDVIKIGNNLNAWRIIDKQNHIVCYVTNDGIDCIKLGQ